MKRIALATLACVLFLGTAGCSWLCCDPCEGYNCPPNPCDNYCNPCGK
jgi:hypothetical protein